MSAQFDLDFGDAEHGGIFFVTSEDLEPLAEAAGMQGLRVCRVNLAEYTDHDALFDRLTQALQLPTDFGRNWDALADSMRDLSWLKASGYILLFDHAQDMRDRNEDDFDMLLDILEEAVDYWQEANAPFFVFFALPESAFDEADA
ncbi:barstar family protein [Dyella telluris]|uniref:Barstar family protein n=1 Tax=Dyella telluris TaxID=2763498 RepID=A0A7G8Q511_9GAMM|nr:barstar family protein [Dyella telluris]QNK01869.1 barstar family protein [Dyella telluris]